VECSPAVLFAAARPFDEAVGRGADGDRGEDPRRQQAVPREHGPDADPAVDQQRGGEEAQALESARGDPELGGGVCVQRREDAHPRKASVWTRSTAPTKGIASPRKSR
jgi:hypothetical protein